jgi:hypothetical protein
VRTRCQGSSAGNPMIHASPERGDGLLLWEDASPGPFPCPAVSLTPQFLTYLDSGSSQLLQAWSAHWPGVLSSEIASRALDILLLQGG